MNLMLHDGTVRCMECMDASDYACEADLPCLYCGAQEAPQEAAECSCEPLSSTRCATCHKVHTEAFEQARAEGKGNAESWDRADKAVRERLTIGYDDSIKSWAVYDDGKRVGYSQTQAGVRLVRRNLKMRSKDVKRKVG